MFASPVTITCSEYVTSSSNSVKISAKNDVVAACDPYDDDDGEEEEDVFIGYIAEQYLRKFNSASGTDNTFGFRDKDGKFYIGSKIAKIK